MPKKLVTIYGKDNCIYCIRACQYLAQRGFGYDYRNLSQDQSLQDEFVQRTDGATTVPQIFVGEDRIGGYEDLRSLPLGDLQAKIGGA